MGKAITVDEYKKAKTELDGCRTKTCPNAGADKEATTTAFCKPCKGANKVVREYERTK